jgi:hypothetical protein
VVMVEGVNAIPPAAAPAIGGKDALAGCRRVVLRELQRAGVEQQRQPGVIWNPAIVLQEKTLQAGDLSHFVHERSVTQSGHHHRFDCMHAVFGFVKDD